MKVYGGFGARKQEIHSLRALCHLLNDDQYHYLCLQLSQSNKAAPTVMQLSAILNVGNVPIWMKSVTRPSGIRSITLAMPPPRMRPKLTADS